MNFKVLYFSKFFGLFLAFLFGLSFFNCPQTLAFGNNLTKNISIHKTEIKNANGNQIILDYYILQSFQSPSRGIFLTLPKNQDGNWTEYQINQVTKSPKITDLNPSLEKNLQNPTFDEKFDQIQEWNELRLRIGEPNTFLANGSYIYHIRLAIPKTENNQNLTLLQNWKDPIGSLEVRIDEQIYCNNQQIVQANCNPKKVQIEINPKTQSDNWYQNLSGILWNIWLNIWIYPVVFLTNLVLIYFLWIIFAKDPDYGFTVDKSEFEPPNILPWQAQSLLDGNLKSNLFLSYLLHLNWQKYIKISTQEPQKVKINGLINLDKIKIEIIGKLPKILSAQFNNCIQKMSQVGFNKGLYDSKINYSVDINNLKNERKKYYSQISISPLIILWVGFGLFVIFCLLPFILGYFQTSFLLGYSYFPLIITNYLIFVTGILVILINFGKLSREGAELKAHCLQYRFYIQKAEKYKLDFGNNPESGVQYYLKNVPFAAMFGYLYRFEKYFQDSFPQNQDLQIVSALSRSFASTNFYVSSDSSSSDSSSSSSSNSSDSSSSGGFDGGGGSW